MLTAIEEPIENKYTCKASQDSWWHHQSHHKIG